MEWSFKSGIPIYQQIIQTMQIRIANGSYPPGSRIPAVRELAVEAGVNPNTMQRALSELERDGLLYSERTSGRFVTREEKVLEELRLQLSASFIEELYERLRGLGLSDAQIARAVREWSRE